MFVFSFDQKESFDHIKDWLNSFKENSDSNKDIPLVLIGNKCDIENKKIDEDLIDEFKKRKGIEENAKTSAKDNLGIDEIFNCLAEKMYNLNKGQKKQKIAFLEEKQKKRNHFVLRIINKRLWVNAYISFYNKYIIIYILLYSNHIIKNSITIILIYLGNIFFDLSFII